MGGVSYLRGMEPAGISDEFSCTRTRCQSANVERSTAKSQLDRFWHVSFVQMSGCIAGRARECAAGPSREEQGCAGYLGVLELLCDVPDHLATVAAGEGAEHQLGPHLGRPRHRPHNGQQLPNLARLQVTDPRWERAPGQSKCWASIKREKTWTSGGGAYFCRAGRP